MFIDGSVRVSGYSCVISCVAVVRDGELKRHICRQCVVRYVRVEYVDADQHHVSAPGTRLSISFRQLLNALSTTPFRSRSVRIVESCLLVAYDRGVSPLTSAISMAALCSSSRRATGSSPFSVA
jgi:hypothetical protein